LVDVDATAIDIPTCNIAVIAYSFLQHPPFLLRQGFSEVGNLLHNVENACTLMRKGGNIQPFVHDAIIPFKYFFSTQ